MMKNVKMMQTFPEVYWVRYTCSTIVRVIWCKLIVQAAEVFVYPEDDGRDAPHLADMIIECLKQNGHEQVQVTGENVNLNPLYKAQNMNIDKLQEDEKEQRRITLFKVLEYALKHATTKTLPFVQMDKEGNHLITHYEASLNETSEQLWYGMSFFS